MEAQLQDEDIPDMSIKPFDNEHMAVSFHTDMAMCFAQEFIEYKRGRWVDGDLILEKRWVDHLAQCANEMDLEVYDAEDLNE